MAQYVGGATLQKKKSKVIKVRICHCALLLTVSTRRDTRLCLCTVQQVHTVTSTQKNHIWNWMKEGAMHGGPPSPIRTVVLIKIYNYNLVVQSLPQAPPSQDPNPTLTFRRMNAPHYNLMSSSLRLRLQTRRYICFNHFVIFSPSEDGGASKKMVTARELKFPIRRSGALLAREPARKRYAPPNWTQMVVFVQGRRPRRGSVARLIIAREWSVCVGGL